jgi:hypothetical protein
MAERCLVPLQVGIQNSATMFQYLDGPVSALVPGVDNADFKWTIDGLGETNCTVDGVSVNNVAINEDEKVCQSPLSIPLAKNATGNQTLEITMQVGGGEPGLSVMFIACRGVSWTQQLPT